MYLIIELKHHNNQAPYKRFISFFTIRDGLKEKIDNFLNKYDYESIPMPDDKSIKDYPIVITAYLSQSIKIFEQAEFYQSWLAREKNTSKHNAFSLNTSIDEAKDIAIEIRNLSTESGSDLSNTLNDFVYNIEVTYQNYYNLGPDNWDKI